MPEDRMAGEISLINLDAEQDRSLSNRLELSSMSMGVNSTMAKPQQTQVVCEQKIGRQQCCDSEGLRPRGISEGRVGKYLCHGHGELPWSASSFEHRLVPTKEAPQWPLRCRYNRIRRGTFLRYLLSRFEQDLMCKVNSELATLTAPQHSLGQVKPDLQTGGVNWILKFKGQSGAMGKKLSQCHNEPRVGERGHSQPQHVECMILRVDGRDAELCSIARIRLFSSLTIPWCHCHA